MKVALILTVFLPLLLIGSPSSGLAQTVGVQNGQWIRYSVTVTASGLMAGQGQVQGWMKVTITDVNWMNISGTVEAGVSGYAQPPTNFYFNVETGNGSTTITTMVPINLILPANLTTGQQIPGGNLTLAGVTQRTYAGASRTVVYATDNAAGATYYWDQATGIFVEMSSSGYGGSAYGATFTATETNIWASELGLLAPGFFGLPWLFWIIIALAGVGSTTSYALVRRRRKPRTTPAPQVVPLAPLPPPPPPQSAIAVCPTCRRPLSYIGQYQRWYCPHCKKYV